LSSPSPEPTSPRRLRRAVGGATWPVRRAAWAFEERLVWAGSDAARSAADSARWPFERLVWALQRGLIWPLQDLFRARSRPARALLALALVGAAAAAAGVGARLGTPEEAGRAVLRAEAVNATATAATPAAAAPQAAASNRGELQGAPPSFAPPEGESPPAAAEQAQPAPASAAAGADPVPVQVSVPPGEVPRAALRVGRRFAEAFVLYEVGEADADVRQAFRETAAPALVEALAERPPRLPQGGEVPRAKVLNVVAGPGYGSTLAVSVSLLRLGSTSELGLQLERSETGWLVKDVRG